MSKNIFLATMSLDIGGAETHIFELAKQLKKEGNRVTVFSAGGAYADRLCDFGIKHITTPVKNKNIFNLIKSYYIIKKEAKKCKPYVIHSHTRITNFVCNMVCKKLNIPMATTVHFNFKLGFFAKIFSKWGLSALSVSDDLKDYVTANYGFDKNDVIVTVNGIDLETFKPAQNSDFRKSLGIQDDEKMILCVSRLDPVASDHIVRFLKSAKMIYENCPKTKIIIVGGGKRFDEIKSIASDINNQTSSNYIKLVGPQTNIADYSSCCDLFVGISRSALEAMACKKPCILLGNAGYLGLYSDKIKEDCIKTNFTCRSYDFISEKKVALLACDILKNPDKYKQNIDEGFNIVKENYSVKKMATDALECYKKANDKLFNVDITILGYYGRQNVGDDLILKSILTSIGEDYKLKRVVVITSEKNKAPIDNISFIYRFDLPKIKKALKNTKLFLMGGGSLFQDTTSQRSIIYYLTIAKMAVKSGAKTMLFANGIGPIHRIFNVVLLKKVLSKFDCLTLRDNVSYEFVKDIDIKCEKIVKSNDSVFLVDQMTDIKVNDDILSKASGKKILGINLRQSNNITEEFITSFAKAINNICKKYDFYVVLIPMHYAQDKPVLENLKSKINVECFLPDDYNDYKKVLSLIKTCDTLISERLHTLILAIEANKPFLALNYDPKISAFCNQLKTNRIINPIENFDVKTFEENFDVIYQDNDFIKIEKDFYDDAKESVNKSKILALKLLNGEIL